MIDATEDWGLFARLLPIGCLPTVMLIFQDINILVCTRNFGRFRGLNQIFHSPNEDISGSNLDLAYRGWTEDWGLFARLLPIGALPTVVSIFQDISGSAHEILVAHQIFDGPEEDISGSNSDVSYRGWTEDVKLVVETDI